MHRTNARRERRRKQRIGWIAVIALALIVVTALGVFFFRPRPKPWEAHVIPREGKALSVVWSYRPTKFSLPAGVDVEAPTWLYVEADSLGKPVLKNLNDMGYSGFNGPEYVAQAHAAGIKIWATVVCFEPELSRQVVADAASRTEFAAALAQWVEASGVDGICFDFEYMDPADKDKYTALVQSACDVLGDKTVVAAVTVPLGYEDAGNWYQCYDRKGLAEAADYLALMCYDAHKDKQQPVAPIEWTRRAVERTLSEVDSSKVLLGVPFYGVDFCGEGDEKPAGTALSAAAMEKLLYEGRMGSEENEVVVDSWQSRGTWRDEWAAMEYAFADTQGRIHTVWMECVESLRARGALMDEYALAGAAVWQKSQGTDALWRTLAEITAEKETEIHE